MIAFLLYWTVCMAVGVIRGSRMDASRPTLRSIGGAIAEAVLWLPILLAAITAVMMDAAAARRR